MQRKKRRNTIRKKRNKIRKNTENEKRNRVFIN